MDRPILLGTIIITIAARLLTTIRSLKYQSPELCYCLVRACRESLG